MIICANRDEFHQRPTELMHFWPTQHIYAGKDLKAGGTWLGVKSRVESVSAMRTIKFSALTNYRMIRNSKSNQDATKENSDNIPPPSRGQLVIDSLQRNCQDTTEKLVKTSSLYEGFNLIYGELNALSTHLYCFDSINKTHQALDKGFHSVCNGALDDIWPKMAKGEQLLRSYIKQESILTSDGLITMMKNSDIAPDELLPSTGLSLEWEKRLSAIFITSPEYGTRSTTILLMNNQGEVQLTQQDYNENGQPLSKAQFNL